MRSLPTWPRCNSAPTLPRGLVSAAAEHSRAYNTYIIYIYTLIILTSPYNTYILIFLHSLYLYIYTLTFYIYTYKKLFSIFLYSYPLYSLPLSFSPLMVLGRYVWRLYCVRGWACACVRVVLGLVGACAGGPAVGCMRLAWQNKGRWRG